MHARVCMWRETILSCPHTFKFRTRLLTGTTSGMASDCVRCMYVCIIINLIFIKNIKNIKLKTKIHWLSDGDRIQTNRLYV